MCPDDHHDGDADVCSCTNISSCAYVRTSLYAFRLMILMMMHEENCVECCYQAREKREGGFIFINK